jgi:hypothetical protein
MVINDPLNHFSSLEFDGLSQGGRKIDVPLFTFGSFDELDFCRVSHI